MAGMFNIQYHVPLVHVDGGESEDEELVTVVEKEKMDVEKKAVIVTDKFRTVEKVLMPENLQDFLTQGKDSVGYSEEEDVYAVLEEDGTEVDEEEYFQLLPSRTRLIVLSTRELWSPVDSMQGSSVFDPSSLLSSRQLAAALIEHLNRSSLGCGPVEGCETGGNTIEQDDFPVEVQAVGVERTAF
jgi:hypothetical protein